jgi:hypothetical protein
MQALNAHNAYIAHNAQKCSVAVSTANAALCCDMHAACTAKASGAAAP